MDANELRLIALVNVLSDSLYPNPDDSGPIGPWAPWIREAQTMGPLSEQWRDRIGVALAGLAGLAGLVDDRDNPTGPRRPHPNWLVSGSGGDLAALNPQPLPPKAVGIGVARALANIALRHAREAGGEQGGALLKRFADDWCGNGVLFPHLPPHGSGEPRPPRPEESVVLGAALFRAAGRLEGAALKKAGEEAGRRIFEHGFSAIS